MMDSSSESHDTEWQICEKIGEPMPDIAGIGILLGFTAQALISMVLAIWVFFLSELGRIVVKNEEGTIEFESEKKRLNLISSMLMVGNNVQMLTGTALIITAWASKTTLDLYHTHLVYDTASFVSISNCAALVCYKFIEAKDLSHNSVSIKQKDRKGLSRLRCFSPHFRATCVYAILFLILAVVLEVRLSNWSLTSEDSGHCYRTDGLAAFGYSHPVADQIYVAVTAVWLLGVMLATVFGSIKLRKPLLICSILQFPLHFYFMVVLRRANSEHLEGKESENDWDFGQTTAMLLLATVVGELFRKGVQYYNFEKDLKNSSPEHAIIRAEAREKKEAKEPGMRAGPIGFMVSLLLHAGRRSRVLHSNRGEIHEMNQSLNRPIRNDESQEV